MNEKWSSESTPPPPLRLGGGAKKNGLSRKVIRGVTAEIFMNETKK